LRRRMLSRARNSFFQLLRSEIKFYSYCVKCPSNDVVCFFLTMGVNLFYGVFSFVWFFSSSVSGNFFVRMSSRLLGRSS